MSEGEMSWIKRALAGSIVALVVHFSAGIWWAATITNDMKYIRVELARLYTDLQSSSDDLYRGQDATKDLAVVHDRIGRNESRIKEIGDKLNQYIGGINHGR